MDVKAVEQLMKAMNETDLTFLELESEGLSIKMKKEKEVVAISAAQPTVEVQKEVVQQVAEKKSVVESSPAVEPVKEGTLIHSPIVGTFYNSPSPEAKPYVSVGDKVKKGDTLCIIEAMKLMNEIESEIDGEVQEILVENEDMVEYNQPLFRIKG